MLTNHEKARAQARLAALRDLRRGSPKAPELHNAKEGSAWALWYEKEHDRASNELALGNGSYVDTKICQLEAYLRAR